MNDKSKKFIPFILITILLVCMITGIVVSKYYLKDNNKINEVIKEEPPKLEIDLNDKEENLDDDNVSNEQDENDDNQDTQVDINDTVQEETNNNNSDTNTNNNQSNTNKPSSSTKPNTNNSSSSNKPSNGNNQNTNDSSNNNSNNNNTNDKVEPAPTQEELNNDYRNALYTSYGVKVVYGNELGDYLVGYYAPTKMTDATEINEYLGRIETELKKYPKRFFKEIRDYGMQLTIYLVKDIPGSDIAGLTNSQVYSNVVISIKASLLFEKTLNHELMHYIDAYLNSKLYPNTVETEWNKLNPTGFTYGAFIDSYDYFPNQNNNAYFFNTYSQTNYKEDRATLFEDIMTRAYKRPCYAEGYPLYSKIKLLAEQIDAGFDCVNSSTTEYWEKFIA